MFLHEDKKLFNKIITEVSSGLGIKPSLVEKDYYVFMLLKIIQRDFKDVLFKGGTSLSKGYNLINRFSEDLDLSMVSTNAMSESQRRQFNHVVENAFKELKLDLTSDFIRYKSDFVCFKAKYNSAYSDSSITDYIKVESVLRRKGRVTNFQQELRSISNYIYTYFSRNEGNKVYLKKYYLTPFDIYCYDIRYTLCEKLIAVGNNYLRGKSERLSRHLYDIHKLMGVIKINNSLREIFLHVLDCTMERGFDDAILNGNNLEVCIYKALQEDFYEYDYRNVSINFIYDKVSYYDVKTSLMFLVEVGLCDTLTRNNLRFNKITNKDVSKSETIYTVVNVFSGTPFKCSKDYILKNNLGKTFTNYKLSKDKRIIRRF